AGLLLDRKRLVLGLSVVEDLSKIARVERLAADWAVDQVLRLVLYRPVMRPALIARRDVVGSNPGHRQVPSVVLAADISRLSRSTVTSGPRSIVAVSSSMRVTSPFRSICWPRFTLVWSMMECGNS
ncbi:hypothetical protein, partial [Mesorhizobium sp. M1233]|uniref:hypothetical protein n=1 Tax=Mesorhizobium sp. M1233 TaxID=2957072 RepID=UPI003338EADC